MGRLVYKGPEGSFAVIAEAKLKPGEELLIPFAAIPEGCAGDENYEVYNDAGELVSGKPKKKSGMRVGSSRTASKEKKDNKTEDKEDSKNTEEVKEDN